MLGQVLFVYFRDELTQGQLTNEGKGKQDRVIEEPQAKGAQTHVSWYARKGRDFLVDR